MRMNTLRNAISTTLFAVASGATSLATAQDADRHETAQLVKEAQDVQHFDLAPSPLGASLDAVSVQSGLRIAYPHALVQNRPGPAVQGRIHWREAMALLLQASGQDYRQADDGTVVIAPTYAEPDRRVAPAFADGREPQGTNAIDLETITVTGTRIRGGTTPSPVIAIGSERIREEGFTDLGDVIRSVPQNFGGGQNPGVAVGATAGAGGRANQNITGGSSLNLRGLGPDATLTLLNGRRLAYGGFVQAVDIGAIPVEAVERVEIVPDGASAIYGSDAVGGVGNVILRQDFDGISAGVRQGSATSGGLDTREFTLTAGHLWEDGGVIVSVKDVSADPIHAHQRPYTAHMPEPNTLYPASDLRSGLLSAHHRVTDAVAFRLDLLRSERTQDIYQWNTGLLPWYNRIASSTTTSLASPGLEIALAGDWQLSIGGSWGRDTHVQRQRQVTVTSGASNTVVHDCYCNDILTYELGAEGPVLALPAGSVRLAVGAGERRNEYTQENRLTDAVTVEGDQRSRFAYAEVGVPVIGPASEVRGIRRLDLTAALRAEDYDVFGSVTTPKLGLVYGPGRDVTLRASWGRSFKAPALLDRYYSREGVLRPASYFGGVGYGEQATVLALGGGNPDLGPERATTRSATLALHPDAWPGFEAELSWFDIDYSDRVIQPITNPRGALGFAGYDQFIDYVPTDEAKAQLLATADIFYNLTGRPYAPDDVVAIVYQHYVNVARQRINGVDVSASYRFDLGPGRLTLRGAGSWLDSTQQVSADAASYEIAGTLFNPAKRNGRAGAVWSHGGLLASVFLNHTAGVANTLRGGSTASFNTIDTALRYETAAGPGAMSGLAFGLSVQNLANREPPLHMAASLDSPPYDSTNYSAIGRFVSLSVSKHW